MKIGDQVVVEGTMIGVVTAVPLLAGHDPRASIGHMEVKDGELTATFIPPQFTKDQFSKFFGNDFTVLEYEGDLMRKIRLPMPTGEKR